MMAYTKRYQKKTPFGKTVKPKKKVEFVPPMKFRFFLWQVPEGEKLPVDTDEQLERVKLASKNKELHACLFSALPVWPRTYVFRVEAWDDGTRVVERIAKTTKSDFGNVHYGHCVQFKWTL
jgi:hypothetical protein